MKKYSYTILSLLGISLAIYGAFLFKNAFVDKGFPSEDVEKEVLLGNYVIMLGLPNNEANRNKYRSLSVAELKKLLKLDEPWPDDEEK